jgi:hypothetical protein
MEPGKAKRKPGQETANISQIRGIAQQSRMTHWVRFGSAVALKPVNPPQTILLA